MSDFVSGSSPWVTPEIQSKLRTHFIEQLHTGIFSNYRAAANYSSDITLELADAETPLVPMIDKTVVTDHQNRQLMCEEYFIHRIHPVTGVEIEDETNEKYSLVYVGAAYENGDLVPDTRFFSEEQMRVVMKHANELGALVLNDYTTKYV